MNLNEVLTKTVSFQNDTWSQISRELTLIDILKEIKSDNYAQKTYFLRDLLTQGNTDGYSIHKKTLPCVTFCGTFNISRRKENLIEYNYIIVLDIDKLSKNELIGLKQKLDLDDHVFAYWDSPSGNGVKGLVPIIYDFPINSTNLDISHKSAFSKLSKYFADKYDTKLDESGSDTTRLCFLSYDKDIVIKNHIKLFEVNANEVISLNVSAKSNHVPKLKAISSRDILFNPQNKNSALNRKTMQSIIKFLEKRKLSITRTYDDWYKVAYAIADTFTYDIGEKYYLSICKLDEDKYEENSCKNMLKYSYGNRSGQVKFPTIIYLANQKGYLTSSQSREVPKMVSVKK